MRGLVACRSDELGTIVTIVRRRHPGVDPARLPRLELQLALAAWRSHPAHVRGHALADALDVHQVAPLLDLARRGVTAL